MRIFFFTVFLLAAVCCIPQQSKNRYKNLDWSEIEKLDPPAVDDSVLMTTTATTTTTSTAMDTADIVAKCLEYLGIALTVAAGIAAVIAFLAKLIQLLKE